MSTSLADLLKLQQRDGFPDLVGTEIAATIPVSERLVSEAVSGLIPQGGRVQDVRITVQDGNQLTAHIRLSGPSFLPAIPVKVSIEDQPLLPDRPILRLRLMSAASLVAMTASFLPALTAALPPGITMDGDRIQLDIKRLLTERKMDIWLNYLTDLRVTTRAGALAVEVRGGIRQK